MKKFVNQEVTFDVEFMGDKVQVRKLPMSKVKEIQNFAKSQEKSGKKVDEETKSNALMLFVFQTAVVGAEELTQEDLESLPVAELGHLFREIMTSVGVNFDEGNTSSGN
jgi:hypothetical protein